MITHKKKKNQNKVEIMLNIVKSTMVQMFGFKKNEKHTYFKMGS